MVGGSFLERYVSPLRIECPATTLSVALMRKRHLNSDFTANNPFYHLQLNFNGTSVLRKSLKCTGGGLGCKEEGYIREGNLPNMGGWTFFFPRRSSVVNSARYCVKSSIFVCKKPILGQTRGWHYSWQPLELHLSITLSSSTLDLSLILNCTWIVFPLSIKILLFGFGLKDKASLFLVGLGLHFLSTYKGKILFLFVLIIFHL